MPNALRKLGFITPPFLAQFVTAPPYQSSTPPRRRMRTYLLLRHCGMPIRLLRPNPAFTLIYLTVSPKSEFQANQDSLAMICLAPLWLILPSD